VNSATVAALELKVASCFTFDATPVGVAAPEPLGVKTDAFSACAEKVGFLVVGCEPDGWKAGESALKDFLDISELLPPLFAWSWLKVQPEFSYRQCPYMVIFLQMVSLFSARGSKVRTCPLHTSYSNL
jgi:hypothetical protein